MDWASLTINLVSIILAFAALVISWREVRRSNSVILELEDFRHGYSANLRENQQQMFHEFSLRLRNRGISLHDVSVCLSFTGSNQRGRFRMPLKTSSTETRYVGEFSRGMTAEFRLKSYELDKADEIFLSDLGDPKSQQAVLIVYSQGYIAKSFRIAKRTDWLLSTWNHLAYRFNTLFHTTIKEESVEPKLIRTREPLPRFKILRTHVMWFTEAVRKGEAKANPDEDNNRRPLDATWQQIAPK